jgi:hypothetical protein
MWTKCKIKLYRHQPSGSSSLSTQSQQTDAINTDIVVKEVYIDFYFEKEKIKQSC